MTTFKKGPNNVTQLSRQNLSYKQPWVQVYNDTVLDSWHVGKYSSATYHITVEFDSNQKETMQVLVVARPEHASYTMFGRTSILDELITLSASVTTNTMTLIVNPASPEFTGARVIFNALYSETLTPLTLPTVVPSSSTGTAGMPTPSNLYGTFSTISVPNNESIVASYELDTLTFSASTGILISTTSETNTVNIGLSLPTASNSTLGGVKVDGSTITINNGIISATPGAYLLPTASTVELGGVKVDGTSITINSSGVISGATTYTLPTASTVELGGVKVDGTSITITNGIISASASASSGGYTLPTASNSTLGGVKVDGTSITINGSGVISGATPYTLPTASNSTLGGVKVDGTSITINNGIISASASAYTLPTASDSVLGGVKVDGVTLAFNGNGQLYYTGSGVGGYTLPTATTSTLGGVKVDGTSITINGSGVISGATTYTLPTASNSTLGGVKVDGNNIAINGSGLLSIVEKTTTLSSTTNSLTIDLTTTTTSTIVITCDTTANQAKTFNFTGTPSTMTVTNIFSINVIVKNNVAISSLTWQRAGVAGNIKWSNGVIPPATLTAIGTGGYDVWTFFTTDGGTTFAGSLSMYGVR